MLTTFDDNEYILKSLKAGAIGYLLKDIPPEDLVGAIKMAFQGIYQLSSAAAGRLVGKLDQENPEDHVLLQNAKSIIWKLSEREREVLKSIAKGLTNKEIADALFITEGTVKNHVSNILASLNLRDRTQAALFVIKSKIL